MDLKDEIKRLALSHPIPQDDKLQRRIYRLERMGLFYEAKLETAPGNQGLMFKSFVSALVYAVAMLKMYRKLTKRLNELAQEGEA